LSRALICFLVGALITAWAWSKVQDEIQASAQERFHFKVAEAQDAVRQRLLSYEQVLRGAAAFFAADNNLSRMEWRTYVTRLELQRQFPGIQAIAYIPVVPKGQLDSYIAGVRREGFPDFDIRPSGAREEYLPVTYIHRSARVASTRFRRE
jgi:CHASE1-domain containing sensor protein